MAGKRVIKKNELENAAREHLELGKLLKKERSPGKKEAVERVLKANYSITRKINEIENIDVEAPVIKSNPYSDSMRVSDEEEAIRNRKKLKRSPNAAKLLNYLFYDFPRIREFGRKTHILSSGFIPWSLKVNKGIHKFFIEQFQKRYLASLINILNYVEKHGWQVLTKREYNLVRVLGKLCHIFFTLDFNLLNYKDRCLIDKLHELEIHFLILYYKPEYIDLIIQSVRSVIEKVEKYKRFYKEIPVMIKRILHKDITLPSLYNLLLGLNMLKFRRYLTLNQLINKEVGHLIGTIDFDCTDKVMEKIRLYVQEIEKNLIPVINRRNEVIKIKAFLPPGVSRNKEFELLEYFYNDKQHDPPFLLAADKSNVIYLTLNLALKFGKVFSPLLNGKIRVNGAGNIEIFSTRFFSMELNKIQFAHEKLEKLSYSITTLSLERFEDLRISAKGALFIEIEIIQFIDEIINLVVDIGKKLAQIILGRQKSKSPVLESNARLEPEILSGKNFFLPHENQVIDSQTILHGRTVLDALSFTCCVCMVTGLFFKNPVICSLLQNEERINKNITTQVDIIRRIADRRRFQEIKLKYNL